MQPQTGFCEAEEGECGPHTNDSGDCACVSGWFDCNEDLGEDGGDGCECSGGCDGTDCESSSGACSPDKSMDCEDSDHYCDGDTCEPCPEGKLNCDGVGECTCGGVCDGDACDEGTAPECSAQVEMDCGDAKHSCTGGKCVRCPEGKLNCDGLAACTCDTVCEKGACKEEEDLTCIDLELQYGAAVSDARECDPAASPDPCTVVVTGDISCNCEIWVNEDKTTSIAIMEHIKATAEQKGCSYSCHPMGCADYTSSSCESLPSGGGECSYH